ncbi:MAG: F0F1 ATP synthase subunit delta [Candidatus Dormibacteria bacterium]
MPEPPQIPSTARHYAEAIFQLAVEEGGFGRWGERLRHLGRLLEESQMGSTLVDPTLRVSQKLELCRAVLQRDRASDKEAGNLLLLLVSSRRQRLLPAIESAYQELVDRREGRTLAQVTTAVELEPEQQRQMEADLSKRLKLEVRFQTKVDPSLLGGAVVRVGDKVFDLSLRTRLSQLRQELAQ